jgi:hypothetical protein
MALCGDLDQPCRPGVLEEREADLRRGARPAVRSRLRRHNPRVLAVVEGHSTSPEGLEDGHHYGFIVTFATPPARDASLNDPNHRPVAEAIGAAAERIVVFDI